MSIPKPRLKRDPTVVHPRYIVHFNGQEIGAIQRSDVYLRMPWHVDGPGVLGYRRTRREARDALVEGHLRMVRAGVIQ